MKLWHRMRCRTNSHVPFAKRVRWDGSTYRGRCKHCGKAIVRVKKGTWRDCSGIEPGHAQMSFRSAFVRERVPLTGEPERHPTPQLASDDQSGDTRR